MANRNRRRLNSPVNIKGINSWIDNIDKSMDSLYSDTYISDRTNLTDLENISDDIERNIDIIARRNSEFDISNISRLYSRLMLKNTMGNDTNVSKSIEDVLGNDDLNSALLTSYLSNKWIKDLDNEIDTVLKYCTKMGEALDLIKDAVISSDSMTKDTMVIHAPLSNDTSQAVFDERVSKLNKKYKISEKRLKWYMNASKYGEQYVYVVPYNKAIRKLLIDKNRSNITMPVVERGVISPGFGKSSGSTLVMEQVDSKGNSTSVKLDGSFKVYIDTGRKLESALESVRIVNEAAQNGKFDGVNTLYESVAEGSKKGKLDKTIDDARLQLPDDFAASDGLVNTKSLKSDKDVDVKIKGAVIKDLKHENLVPMYLDDVCMGYQYYEFNNGEGYNFYNNVIDSYSRGYNTSDTKSLAGTLNSGLNATAVEDMLKKLSRNISDKIDAQFVNSNQDLAPEIYAILKHNNVFNCMNNGDAPDSVKISFLPVEDVHRLCFDEDETTHRGKSDCLKGLIPAKLFSCLYITNSTGILTRGQDKRVYYVKQTVETNIAQTMLNVINQIKKSNFNIRQIENMNNVLNITGRFNDFVIPVGPSGDSPVQFEVMPGQQFEINSDLYNMLEEMAVNSTGCPIELVQSRMSPDFATQFTSSSIKILRMVYGRQSIYEGFESEIWTKIYNYEYGDIGQNIQIECELPPPIFLSMTNTSQLINNTHEYVQQIADYEYEGVQGDNVDVEKSIFIKKMMRSILSSYVKNKDIERHKNLAKMEVEKMMTTQNQDQ